ncbi:MAG: hypothetical protein WBD31_20275 [Rubripirellula sp.]
MWKIFQSVASKDQPTPCFPINVADDLINATLDNYDWVLLTDGVRGMDIEADPANQPGGLRFRVDLDYQDPYDEGKQDEVEKSLREKLRTLSGIDTPEGEAIQLSKDDQEIILVPLWVSPRDTATFFDGLRRWIAMSALRLRIWIRLLRVRVLALLPGGPAAEPVIGGQMIVKIGNSSCITPGTVATSLIYGSQYRLLTNNHVVTNNQHHCIDSTLYVEGKATSMKLDGYYKIVEHSQSDMDAFRSGQKTLTYNVVDLAWCDTTPLQAAQRRIIDVEYHQESIDGFRRPVRCETVTFYGSSSNTFTTTKVLSTTYRVRNNVANYRFWKNIVRLDTSVAIIGDSGTAIVATETDEDGNEKHMVVGLIRHLSSIPNPCRSEAFGCPLHEPNELEQELVVASYKN